MEPEEPHTAQERPEKDKAIHRTAGRRQASAMQLAMTLTQKSAKVEPLRGSEALSVQAQSQIFRRLEESGLCQVQK